MLVHPARRPVVRFYSRRRRERKNKNCFHAFHCLIIFKYLKKCDKQTVVVPLSNFYSPPTITLSCYIISVMPLLLRTFLNVLPLPFTPTRFVRSLWCLSVYARVGAGYSPINRCNKLGTFYVHTTPAYSISTKLATASSDWQSPE